MKLLAVDDGRGFTHLAVASMIPGFVDKLIHYLEEALREMLGAKQFYKA